LNLKAYIAGGFKAASLYGRAMCAGSSSLELELTGHQVVIGFRSIENRVYRRLHIRFLD
jgi:hypothetical protein